MPFMRKFRFRRLDREDNCDPFGTVGVVATDEFRPEVLTRSTVTPTTLEFDPQVLRVPLCQRRRFVRFEKHSADTGDADGGTARYMMWHGISLTSPDIVSVMITGRRDDRKERDDAYFTIFDARLRRVAGAECD